MVTYPFLLVRRPTTNPIAPPMKALCVCHMSLRERQEVLATQTPSTNAATTAMLQPALAMRKVEHDTRILKH
jgi:hypothetical protein